MVTTSSTPSGRSLLGRFWALPWTLKLAVGGALPIVAFLGLTAALNLFNYSVGSRTGHGAWGLWNHGQEPEWTRLEPARLQMEARRRVGLLPLEQFRRSHLRMA